MKKSFGKNLIFYIFSILIFILCFQLLLVHKSYSLYQNPAPISKNVKGLIYVNDLDRLTREQFARIRDCGELKYVLTQIILYPDIFSKKDALEKDRIIELAKAGKKMIVQIWFGPGGPYNWSYCGYPNIAMQQEVRDYLFPVIDQVIDQIGPENIYGMHMLEEDGHFGVDIDQPGNWRQNMGAVRSGREDGDAYTNFSNLRKLYHGPSDWTPSVPNIAQYNPIFKAESGYDMFNLPKDNELARPVLDRWMARRLWVGAHREFFKHLEEKYPTIRKFVWGNIAQPWNGTAIGDLRDIADGVITNPYLDTLSTHHALSGLKTLLPEAEHLILLKGNPDISMKYMGAATAYLNGASGIGFFESALSDEKLWNDNIRVWRKISILPVIEKFDPKVLIVTGNTDNGYSTSKRMLPFVNMPAVLTDRDATDVDLRQYDTVILHACTSFKNDLAMLWFHMKGYGPDDMQLRDWVIRGGILVLTAPYFTMDSQFFVADERIVWTKNRWPIVASEPAKFVCKESIAQKYNIKPVYNLVASVRETLWGPNISYDKLPIGGVVRYGQGRIVILPVFHNDRVMLDKDTSIGFQNLWQKEVADYIADVVRGVAKLQDRTGALANEFNTLYEPFGLEWRDRDKDIKIQIKFERFGQKHSSEVIRSGDFIMGSQ